MSTISKTLDLFNGLIGLYYNHQLKYSITEKILYSWTFGA